MTNGVIKKGKNGEPDRAVMGAGTALQAKILYPGLDILLAQRLAEHGNRLYVFELPPVKREALGCLFLVTFPTKYDYKDPAQVDLIYKNSIELSFIADALGWKDILMPEPGTGLQTGGLAWSHVKQSLSVLDNRFTVVHYMKEDSI